MDAKAPTLDEIPPSRIVGCLLAGLALVVGVWYAAFGVSLLMNLPLATHRWIVASGDQDFWLDVSFFRRAGAVLAVIRGVRERPARTAFQRDVRRAGDALHR